MTASLSASVSVHRVYQLALSCSLRRRRPSQLLLALTSTIAHKPQWMQQKQIVQQDLVPPKCLA